MFHLYIMLWLYLTEHMKVRDKFTTGHELAVLSYGNISYDLC